MSERLTRNAIVARLGTPDKTEGNLNSPVELEEYGIRFNEKWIYDHLGNDPSGLSMRLIYWHRYDFTGTLVRKSAEAEWLVDTTLNAAVKGSDDRLALVESRHESLTGNRNYRAASEVHDAQDLGGYIEGEKD
jgi:hypothetical protein